LAKLKVKEEELDVYADERSQDLPALPSETEVGDVDLRGKRQSTEI
jgi:hypothetical protein